MKIFRCHNKTKIAETDITLSLYNFPYENH